MSLLWTDFCNSEWRDWRGSGRITDRLQDPEFLAEFLKARHLAAPVPPLPTDMEALLALRSFLRRMGQTLAEGRVPADEDRQLINNVMSAGPVFRQLSASEEGHRLDLVPLHQGWPSVMAEIAASFAQTLARGESNRVRICDNPDCMWIFYDDTRNRTKRFCDDKLCGNLMKVRRFRAKQKGQETTAP